MADKNNAATDNNLLQPMHTQVFGAPGTWITGGFISNEEYLPQLLWRRGIDVYDHMRRSDASIQALLKVVKHPLLSATWDIEPASDKPFDEYAARFVKNELFNRNVVWYRTLRDILGKCEFGFSVFEKTYEMTEFEGQQRVGINEIGWRKQWSVLKWETNEGDPGITQQLLGDLVSIPQEKLLVFVNDREGDNYQGVSLLRYVYKDWDLKKAAENLLIVDAMRSLGFPIVEYNDQASGSDQIKMENILKNFRASERQYLFFPKGKYTFDWAKVESNTKNLLMLVEHLQHEIDKSVLAQFLDLSGSRTGASSGSHALSADQSQLFEKALEAIANEVVDEINNNLLQQLCDLNWSDMPNGYPKLIYSNIGDQNLPQMADYFNKLAQVDLITPDPDLENQLRQWGGAKDLPDDVYKNYADRVTPQTQALPLTKQGPGQDPNNPQDTGRKLKDPPTGNIPGKKDAHDQTNRVTRTNMKKDRANKPTPEANSYKLKFPNNARTSQILEDAKEARKALLASIMED